MFKDIQKEVNKLEDFINKHAPSAEDDVFVLVTHLLAEAGEAADEIKGMEGKRAESPDLYTKEALAKEVIDVIFNLLRITRYYDIELDEFFMKRINGIMAKFEKLIKPSKVYINKDLEARLDYWESQYSKNYSKGEINSAFKQILLKYVKGLKNPKVLDHACGEGYLKRFFEDRGSEAYGIEWSWTALAKAAKISPDNLERGTIDKLPFDDSMFDVVLSRRILHSNPLDVRIAAIKEADRVLKKGGIFICSVQDIGDKFTLSRYKEVGVELKDDKSSYVADILVKGKPKQRMKHFYSKKDITSEIEKNSSLKVVDIEQISSKAGWCSDFQKYLVVKAKK